MMASNRKIRKEKATHIGSPSRSGEAISICMAAWPRSYKLHWKQCEQCRVKKNSCKFWENVSLPSQHSVN